MGQTPELTQHGGILLLRENEMPRQILLHDIEQFERVRNVPNETISPDIIAAVRQLREKEFIEPAIRDLLFDPTETPHGPTEIADILGRVLINGRPCLAAFLLKGRSLQRVTSREIAHQFIRLRQVPDLQLSVLLAVGHIQDDARRDFIRSALDSGSDYLIVDSHDIARLLIAYEKLCPQDGSPYDDTGVCEHGHRRDPGVELQYRVMEDPRYEVTNLQDVSHASAKRYSAIILVDKHYPRAVLREIIQRATEEVRQSSYTRNERLEEHWGHTPAHVVWLFLAYYPEDIRRTNWVCRTQWIDPALSPDSRPIAMTGDEILHGISIKWEKRYEELKKLYDGFTASKGDFLAQLRPIVRQMLQFGDSISSLFDQYRTGRIFERAFIAEMERLEPIVSELYTRSGDLPMPPHDAKDYDQTCRKIFGAVDDMVLPFSELGKQRWDRDRRNGLIHLAVDRYKADKDRLRFEEEKLH